MGRSTRRTLLSLAAVAVAVAVLPAAAVADPPDVGTWTKIGEKTFGGALTPTSLAAALYRGQGVAVDGTDFVFSGNHTLLRTKSDGSTTEVLNSPAIPADLAAAGSDHIGDPDVYAGKLWAPIEDGDHYLNPVLELYDAKTLVDTGTRYVLGTSLLTDGVPWVAVDGPRGKVYTATWNGTTVLDVRSLADPTQVSTVTLSEPVPRIQGAKMLNGLLYAARDNDAAKSIVAIDPTTGTVTPVFDRALGASPEAEGIAFRTTPACGTVLYSLDNEGITVRLTAYGRMPTPAGCDPFPAPPKVVVTPPPPPPPPPPPTTTTPTLAKVTNALLAKARIQLANGTKGSFTTLTKRRSSPTADYRVRVRSGSRNLATGTVHRRKLKLTVAKGTSASKRAKVTALVRKKIRDLRSISVKMR